MTIGQSRLFGIAYSLFEQNLFIKSQKFSRSCCHHPTSRNTHLNHSRLQFTSFLSHRLRRPKTAACTANTKSAHFIFALHPGARAGAGVGWECRSMAKFALKMICPLLEGGRRVQNPASRGGNGRALSFGLEQALQGPHQTRIEREIDYMLRV